MSTKIQDAMEKYEAFIDKTYMINKVFLRFMVSMILLLSVVWIATLWCAYDLRKQVNYLKLEKSEVEETLADWKHSNQVQAVQLKQKHEYIEELLQRLRQFQDEIEIVKIREENDG